MNSRNISEKDNKSGWARRDNRQQRFKKDVSSQDFYNQDWKTYNNNQDWKNRPKRVNEVSLKVDKTFNVSENYASLISPEFKWYNYCILE